VFAFALDRTGGTRPPSSRCGRTPSADFARFHSSLVPQGVLLIVCGDRATRRSADGRCPVENVTEYFDVAVHQVRAGAAALASSNSQSETPAPRVLEADELTILTGWAQALAESLEYAPECVEALLADEVLRSTLEQVHT
jgi:hypothetical protein